MRTCSEAPGLAVVWNSERTSQTACARKARSRDPAKNWGRPKRSRVKNRGIRQDEGFYHERAGLRETSAMDEGTNISSEPQVSPPNGTTAAPDFGAAVQPSYVRTVFWGPDGLRAGWGFAFYVAMFYPLQFAVSRWIGSLELDPGGLWSMMLEEFGMLLAATLPAVVLGAVERRAWGIYGLPVRLAFGKLFGVGAG